MQPNFPSILILTGSFGHGHNTAAFNLERAFRERLGEDATIAVVDFFQETYPFFNTLLRKGYGFAINQTPRLWHYIYGQADREGGPRLLPVKTFSRSLSKCLNHHSPSIVVSTFPAFPLLISQLYPDPTTRPFRLATIITDAISINAIWCQGHSDLLFVADEWSKAVVMETGISETRIHAHGFPLTAVTEPASQLAMTNTNLKLLYLATTATAHVIATLEQLVPWCRDHQASLTIVLGTHEKRLRRIAECTTANLPNVAIHGWHTEVPRLMREHHLTLTKAGGASVSEALGARCPVIINYVVPGQEEGNAELVHRSDCGLSIQHPSELPKALSQVLLENDAATWRRHRENLSAMNRAEASQRIVSEILTQTSDAGDSSSKSSQSPQ